MSQDREGAIPLWIDKEKEWSVMEEKYSPDGTIQLYASIRREAEHMVPKGASLV
jgi:hypothetical protein